MRIQFLLLPVGRVGYPSRNEIVIHYLDHFRRCQVYLFQRQPQTISRRIQKNAILPDKSAFPVRFNAADYLKLRGVGVDGIREVLIAQHVSEPFNQEALPC